jgi:hypothetical protein
MAATTITSTDDDNDDVVSNTSTTRLESEERSSNTSTQVQDVNDDDENDEEEIKDQVRRRRHATITYPKQPLTTTASRRVMQSSRNTQNMNTIQTKNSMVNVNYQRQRHTQQNDELELLPQCLRKNDEEKFKSNQHLSSSSSSSFIAFNNINTRFDEKKNTFTLNFNCF